MYLVRNDPNDIEENATITDDTDGRYAYTKDLLALEAKRSKVPPLLPALGKSISSPLLVHNWKAALRNHPDQSFVSYLLQGVPYLL